jgi:hypothetical protein
VTVLGLWVTNAAWQPSSKNQDSWKKTLTRHPSQTKDNFQFHVISSHGTETQTWICLGGWPLHTSFTRTDARLRINKLNVLIFSHKWPSCFSMGGAYCSFLMPKNSINILVPFEIISGSMWHSWKTSHHQNFATLRRAGV